MVSRKRWLQQVGGIVVAKPPRKYQGSSSSNRRLTTKKMNQGHGLTWSKLLKWLTGWFPQKPQQIPQPIRRKVDTQGIRTRIGTLGWKVHEIPIRKSSPIPEERQIASWRLIAARGDRSVEVSGSNIDEAFNTLGVTLGVVPRNN